MVDSWDISSGRSLDLDRRVRPELGMAMPQLCRELESLSVSHGKVRDARFTVGFNLTIFTFNDFAEVRPFREVLQVKADVVRLCQMVQIARIELEQVQRRHWASCRHFEDIWISSQRYWRTAEASGHPRQYPDHEEEIRYWLCRAVKEYARLSKYRGGGPTRW